jgi:hypothetical protein
MVLVIDPVLQHYFNNTFQRTNSVFLSRQIRVSQISAKRTGQYIFWHIYIDVYTKIVDDEVMIVLEKLAQLVMHFLSPKGDERPTMKEVAERLQMLRRLRT